MLDAASQAVAFCTEPEQHLAAACTATTLIGLLKFLAFDVYSLEVGAYNGSRNLLPIDEADYIHTQRARTPHPLQLLVCPCLQK